ncbi:MAG: hypothetical protein H0W25_18550, partial [Acidimicrobiia bacterium]|nr:hypothetical protein [Acidimicrobiia bacterium]
SRLADLLVDDLLAAWGADRGDLDAARRRIDAVAARAPLAGPTTTKERT